MRKRLRIKKYSYFSVDKEEDVQQANAKLCWKSSDGLPHTCHLTGSDS